MFQRTGELVGLYPHILTEIVDAYKVESQDHHFTFDRSCPACVAEAFVKIFKWLHSYTQQQ